MDKYLLTRSILNAAAQSIRCSIQYICVEKALKCATCDILIGIHCQKVNNSSIVSQYEQHFISVAQASFFFSSFVLRLLYELNVIECKWYSALQWQGYHSSIYWEEWKKKEMAKLHLWNMLLHTKTQHLQKNSFGNENAPQILLCNMKWRTALT